MGRKLRYIPEGGALVEVTCRTLQGRLLLRPSPELNDIAAGILGRAQRLYPVDLVAFQALSNHYHALVFVKTAKRLAEFAGYLTRTWPGRWAGSPAGPARSGSGATRRSWSATRRGRRSRG